MSSYSYQPKVFRYTNGCCICKAKSSSSRFTSSQKYESEFVHCFNLKEHRTGKICNACVLIFKRWRKLPERYSRNWEHVVDSKDKQGRKTCRKKTEKSETPDISNLITKHRYIPKPSSRHDDFSDDQGLGEEFGGSSASSISGEERLNDGGFLYSTASSYAGSPNHPRYAFDALSDANQKSLTALFVGAARRKQRRHLIRRLLGLKKSNLKIYSEFIDSSCWRQFNTPHGVGYVSDMYQAIMFNPEFYENLSASFAANSSLSRASPSATSISSSHSDVGSNLEDEGVDSFDEEHSSLSMSPSASFYQSPSSSHQSTLSSHQSTLSSHQSTSSSHLGMNMLMQLSAALRI